MFLGTRRRGDDDKGIIPMPSKEQPAEFRRFRGEGRRDDIIMVRLPSTEPPAELRRQRGEASRNRSTGPPSTDPADPRRLLGDEKRKGGMPPSTEELAMNGRCPLRGDMKRSSLAAKGAGASVVDSRRLRRGEERGGSLLRI